MDGAAMKTKDPKDEISFPMIISENFEPETDHYYET